MLSMRYIESIYAELAANAALVLLGVACSLLSRQVAAQAKAFEDAGGFTERLYRIRSDRRRGSGGRREEGNTEVTEDCRGSRRFAL